MRLYPPPGQWAARRPREIELGPYMLPAGTYLLFSQYILQRSAEYFPDPLRFDPERFTPEQKAARHRFRLLPIWRRRTPVHRRSIRLDGRGFC